MTKYKIKFTSKFKKDLKAIKKQNKDTNKLLEVIEFLANGLQLEEKYKDHELIGEYQGVRECHIEPDWLLIYEINETNLLLILTRTGSHSKLFK